MYSYHAAHHILTPTAQKDTAFQTAMSQWMIIQSPCSYHPLHQIPTPQLQREEKTLESDNNLVEKKNDQVKQTANNKECSIPSIHLLHCTASLPTYPLPPPPTLSRNRHRIASYEILRSPPPAPPRQTSTPPPRSI
jgi:hypothetical protein